MRLSTALRRPLLFGLLALGTALPLGAIAETPYLIPQSGTLGDTCDFVTGEMHFECIPLYLAYLIKVVFGLLGTICLLEIIWGGYEYMTAFSSDTSGAKNRIKHAIMGLIFAILSFLIVDTIVSVLFPEL